MARIKILPAAEVDEKVWLELDPGQMAALEPE
jgi:hypothetical protein